MAEKRTNKEFPALFFHYSETMDKRKKNTVKLKLFSQREIQIIRLICRQFSNKEIAKQLGLSFRTVEGYRENIIGKMKVKNTAGIVIYAIRNKIFPI